MEECQKRGLEAMIWSDMYLRLNFGERNPEKRRKTVALLHFLLAIPPPQISPERIALDFLQNISKEEFEIEEKVNFCSNGMMMDCSRNGVPTVDTIKQYVVRMAYTVLIKPESKAFVFSSSSKRISSISL